MTQPTKPARGKRMSTRITNEDLNTRLVRIEETMGTTANTVKEASDKLGKVAENSIRTESAVKEHDGKITHLYLKHDEAAKVQADTARKADKIVNYGSAIGAVAALLGGAGVAFVMWFLNQQASALQGISDSVKVTVQTVQQIDRRLTVVELKQQLGIKPDNQGASK